MYVTLSQLAFVFAAGLLASAMGVSLGSVLYRLGRKGRR